MRARVPLIAAVLALAAALVATGCGGASSTTSTASAPPTAASQIPGCRPVPAPRPRTGGGVPRPQLRLDPARRYTVTMHTNCGTILIGLDVRDQPRTAASFAYLVRRGFYDGLGFHRIATGFVIQGGDPEGSGTGGPGYTVVEPPPAGARYAFGTVAMAKTGVEPSGASGSQFFIVTAPDAHLPPQYAIAGHVVGGSDAVRRIAAVPASPQSERPILPVVIARATLASR